MPRILASGVEAKTSRISSNTLMYVAGLLLGVRPIGSCETLMTLERSLTLSMPSHSRVRLFEPERGTDIAIEDFIDKEDFPRSDTPVTTVNVPRGIYRHRHPSGFVLRDSLRSRNPGMRQVPLITGVDDRSAMLAGTFSNIDDIIGGQGSCLRHVRRRQGNSPRSRISLSVAIRRSLSL